MVASGLCCFAAELIISIVTRTSQIVQYVLFAAELAAAQSIYSIRPIASRVFHYCKMLPVLKYRPSIKLGKKGTKAKHATVVHKVRTYLSYG